MIFLWLVITVVSFSDGAQMGQYVPLSLPHFCMCEKTNIMKIVPRRMCIYNSSNGSEYMSDCLSQVNKVFHMCQRNRVSCFHIKFDLGLKKNKSRSSALQFVRDKKNHARTLIFAKNNPVDDQYLKKFDIMAKVFSKLFEDQKESFDLIPILSELEDEKNASKKPNFHYVIAKANSNTFLTLSEARNLKAKFKKNVVLMSTAMTDVGFTFNGSKMSFFDEDFWNLVKHQFEFPDELKVIAPDEDGLGYEDTNGKGKDEILHVENFEGKAGKHEFVHLKGKNFSDVEGYRGKGETASGRTHNSRKNKPDLIFLISMGTDSLMNTSDLKLNITDVADKEQDLEDTFADDLNRRLVPIEETDSVENEIYNDLIKSHNESQGFGRRLLQYKKKNGKGFRLIKNDTLSKSRQRRALFPHNDWCCIPKKTLHANLRCKVWSYKKVCTLTCLPGYSLNGKPKAKMCCKRKEKKWNPGFKPCESKSLTDGPDGVDETTDEDTKKGKTTPSIENQRLDEFYDVNEGDSPGIAVDDDYEEYEYEEIDGNPLDSNAEAYEMYTYDDED